MRESAEYRTPCEKPDGRDESDLCAQWKAADAAESAAQATWFGVLIGALTLIAAGAAAIFARDAAIHTERGANAADEAVKETRRIGEAQTRAYLSVTLGALTFNPMAEQGKVAGRATNTGMTPADQFNIQVIGQIFDSGKVVHDLVFRRDSIMDWDVIRGQAHEVITLTTSRLPEILLAPARECQLAVLIEVRFSYRDVFGSEYGGNLWFSGKSKPMNNNDIWFEFERKSGSRSAKNTPNDGSPHRG